MTETAMYYDDIRLNRPFIFEKQVFHSEDQDNHIHDVLEVGLVDEQEVSYRFGNRTIIGRQGDVFVCRPFEPHWGVSSGGGKVGWSMLLFAPSVARLIPGGFRLLVPFYTEWLPSPVIRAETPQAKAIAGSFTRALRAAGQSANTADAEQFLCLLEILLQIYVHASKHAEGAPEQQEEQRIIHAVNHLLQHHTGDISMDELADICGEKRSKFFEKFRAFTGVSPNQFLIRLRVQHAMDLLHRFPEMSVLDVCAESGFQSLRAFNNQFKNYAGLSPTEYRKDHRGYTRKR